MAHARFLFSRCIAITAALLLLTSACVGYIVLDIQQRKIIFQPDARVWQRTNTQDIAQVWISYHSAAANRAVRLHGLWLPQTNPQAPVLLYLHGRRWNVTAATQRMRNMHSLGFSVLAIDYRGFGKTMPRTLPSQVSVQEDAMAAWQWLRTHHPQQQRVIFGHSLGGAIAVQLAAKVADEQALLLESTFTSVESMARNYKWGWIFTGPLVTQKFDSLSLIGQVGSPVLLVHGDKDRTISSTHSQVLFSAAQAPKKLVLIEEGTHHNVNTKALSQYRKNLPWLLAPHS